MVSKNFLKFFLMKMDSKIFKDKTKQRKHHSSEEEPKRKRKRQSSVEDPKWKRQMGKFGQLFETDGFHLIAVNIFLHMDL